MSPRLSLVLYTAVFAIVASGGAWAGGGRDRTDNGNAHDRNQPTKQASAADNNLPDSVRRAERETGGQVLRAQPIQRDGREVYRVKVLTPEGRVKVVEDDRGAPAPESHAPASDAPKPESNHH